MSVSDKHFETLKNQMSIDREQLIKERQEEHRLKQLEKKQIKKFCNHSGYSDINPYEVVRVISEQTVEVRAMDTKQTVFPKDFQIGGFSAHCADNYNQEYEYSSNEENEVFRVRWSKANNQWQRGKYMRFYMSDTPHKHYDYNF